MPSLEPSFEPVASPEPSPVLSAEPSPEPLPSEEPAPSDPAPSAAASDPAAASEEPAPAATPDATEAPRPSSPAPAAERTRLDPAGRWIVLLRSGADTASVRDRHARREGLRVDRSFGRAIRGFAGPMTQAQVAALRADPDVVAVVPDEIVETASQLVPTGVARIGSRSTSQAAIDGVDHRVDADVAVVDTGIDATHPDLNVVGGYNCSTSDRSAWRDREGHGTHVAGTIGAIDNGAGVVGVAPGVRLWAVKILNDDGFGYLSWYICGLDWIAAQRDPSDASRPRIEAVNMSVAKWGTDDGNCGESDDDLLHQAICRLVRSGVTVVAAAANDAGSAAARVPAAYNEVITVSALADTDGKAGGLGGNRCWSWGTYDRDDTFADFSNYGYDVDIIAPGKCIWSTLPGNRYGYSSGTSMAAPAVTGAVALYKATRPWMAPGPVKGALQVLGNSRWYTSTDPDSTHERLLDVSRLGAGGSFSVAVGSGGAIGEAGGTVQVPVQLGRSATHFERIWLSAAGPKSFGFVFDRTALAGFASAGAVATAATLTVTVPPSLPAGSYAITVTANEGTRTQTATTQIVVEREAPTAFAATAAPAYQSAMGKATAPVRIAWPAATDPTSTIAAYELEQATDWAGWVPAGTVDGTARSVVRQLPVGHGYSFRIRARDAAGNWSSWVAGAHIRLGVFDSSATSMRYGTGWRKLASSWAWRGTLARTERSGAVVRLAANARTVAIVAPVGPRQGWFRVFVNGVDRGRISLWAKVGASRKVLWVRTFEDGLQRIELRAETSRTRYRADLDAIIVQR
jgi:subtilisin